MPFHIDQGRDLNLWGTRILNKKKQEITILFDFISDVTDGIGNIQLVSNPDDQRIYTIDGRLAGSSVESLPKGLYIINKKKVFIK